MVAWCIGAIAPRRRWRWLENSWCVASLCCATRLTTLSLSGEVSRFDLPGKSIGLKCLYLDWAIDLSLKGESVNVTSSVNCLERCLNAARFEPTRNEVERQPPQYRGGRQRQKTKPSIKVADRLLIGQVITNPNGLRNLAKHHGRYAPRRSECAYQTSFLSLDAGACFIDGLWTTSHLGYRIPHT